MSLYALSGRFAQIGGLIVAIVCGALWLGDQAQRGLLFAAGIGLFIFIIGTVVFAIIGDVAHTDKNWRELRKSGWR